MVKDLSVSRVQARGGQGAGGDGVATAVSVYISRNPTIYHGLSERDANSGAPPHPFGFYAAHSAPRSIGTRLRYFPIPAEDRAIFSTVDRDRRAICGVDLAYEDSRS